MSNLTTFNFQNTHSIRTATDDKGEFWFLANDVCEILGYKNTSKAVTDHCKDKGVTKLDTPAQCDITNGYATSKARKTQEMVYINEPNLYRLIIKSRKPEAEAFEEWVMEEVLPTIRKTGSYQLPKISKEQKFNDCSRIWKALNRFRTESWMTRQKAESILLSTFKVSCIDNIPYHQIPEALELVYETLALTRDNAKKSCLSLDYIIKSSGVDININEQATSSEALDKIDNISRRLSAINSIADILISYGSEQVGLGEPTLGAIDAISDLSQQIKDEVNSLAGNLR